MPAPLFKVEVAFADGPNAAAPTWTDISQYVRRVPPLSWSRGNTDELPQLQAGTMTFTVDNSNGRFTPGSAASTSAWGTVLQIRRPVRLTVWDGSSYVATWRGTVDDWGAGWVGGVKGQTQVTCSDLIAEGGRILFDDAVLMDLRSLGSAGCAIYPLATSGADASGAATAYPDLVSTNVGNGGGSITFGTQLALGPDESAGVTFAPATGSDGRCLQNTTAFTVGSFTADAGSLSAYVRPSAATSGRVVMLTNGTEWISLNVTGSTGDLSAEINTGSFSLATANLNLADGRLHHIGAWWSTSAGTTTLTVYADGVQVASTTATSTTTSFTTLRVGATSLTAFCYTGDVAMVAAYKANVGATAMTDLGGALTGWAGESGSARFTRLCGYGRLDSSRYVVGSGTSTATMGIQPLAGKTLAAALQEVADVEQGSIFVSPSGVLTYNARSNRYGKSSSLTIAPQSLERDLSFVTNDAYLVNEATVTRASDGYRFTASASSSKTAYGLVTRAVSAGVDTAEQVVNLAQWLTYRYAEPGVRARTFTINGTTKAASVSTINLLALNVDSRVTLSPLPAVAPSSSVQLYIDGVSGEVGEELSFTYNTSPTNYLDGWVLGTSTLDVGTLLLY